MPDHSIRPEDIKPGDWVRFDSYSVAVVKEIVLYSDGSPSRLLGVIGPPWSVHLSDVLEVRRG